MTCVKEHLVSAYSGSVHGDNSISSHWTWFLMKKEEEGDIWQKGIEQVLGKIGYLRN
jgi:hypothetical protein